MTDATDLIDGLCTFAGMLLEDVHDIALIRNADVSQFVRIAAIQAAAQDIDALARAAEVVRLRFG